MMWYFAGVPIIPQNQAWFLVIFVFTCLAFAVVLMRVYSRVFLTRLVGLEDWLMFLSMGLSIAYVGTIVHEIDLGLGYGVRPEETKSFLHTEFFTTLIYIWNQWITKMSISALYYRIFSTEKPRKILQWIILWLVIYGLVNCITPIFSCVPVQKFWDNDIPGSCMEWGYLHYALSAINIVNDFMLLIFPIPILIKLNVSVRVRVILVLTLTCGLVASIVSILRLHALVAFVSAPIEKKPVIAISITTWSSLEINLAIMCSSVASLKPLFARFIPHLDAKSTSPKTPGREPVKQQSDQSSIPLESFNGRTVTSRGSCGDVEAGIGRSKFWFDESRDVKTSMAAENSSQKAIVAGSSKSEDGSEDPDRQV